MSIAQQLVHKDKWTGEWIKRYILITLGIAVGAFAKARFLGANSIATGGIFGVGVVLQLIFPWLDPGIFGLLLNIPLLAIAWFILGREFVFNTAYSTILFNVLVTLYNKYIPYHPNDLMLSGVIGGAIWGIGLTIVLMRNSTTGGVDIIARLVQKKFPHIKIGAMILILDATVIISLMVVKRNMEIGYIAIISHVISSFVVDTLIQGFNLAKVVHILSDKYQEIAQVLMEKMGRGITSMQVTGMYSSQDRKMLMCVAKVDEINEIKKIIHQIDGSAFVIVSQAHEVLGTGFKKLGGLFLSLIHI